MTQKQILRDIVREIKRKPSSTGALKSKLKRAIQSGVDVNQPLYRGRTLMHYAVKANAKGTVRILGELGVDARVCDLDYNTPLHFAILHDCYYAIKELLKLEIDINALGEFEQTPLHLAVIKGNLDIIKLLINHGADLMLVDEKNLTPLDYAIDENNEKIIKYLQSCMKEYAHELQDY